MTASVLVEVEEDDDADCCFEVTAPVMAMDDADDSPGEGCRCADEEHERQPGSGLVAVEDVHGLVGGHPDGVAEGDKSFALGCHCRSFLACVKCFTAYDSLSSKNTE